MSTRFRSGPPINNNKHREPFFKSRNISKPLDSESRWKPQHEVVSRRNAKCDWYVDWNWQLCMGNWDGKHFWAALKFCFYLFVLLSKGLRSATARSPSSRFHAALEWNCIGSRAFEEICVYFVLGAGRFFRKWENKWCVNARLLTRTLIEHEAPFRRARAASKILNRCATLPAEKINFLIFVNISGKLIGVEQR